LLSFVELRQFLLTFFILRLWEKRRLEKSLNTSSSIQADSNSSALSSISSLSSVASSSASKLQSYFVTPKSSIKQVNGNIKTAFKKIEDDQAAFEEEMVCMMISCNLSLNLCDNPDFNKKQAQV
jgi:hypothetical protein